MEDRVIHRHTVRVLKLENIFSLKYKQHHCKIRLSPSIQIRLTDVITESYLRVNDRALVVVEFC